MGVDIPSAAASSLAERQKRYIVPGVATYYDVPLVIDHGIGCYLFDTSGRKYLDFFGGILTVSIGHAHPKVTEAVTQQIRKVTHTSTLYLTQPMVEVAEELARITPPGLEMSFFTSSGTEANETAIAMARLATGNYDVIALRHSYSGRSSLTMSLTGQSPWRMGLLAQQGIYHVRNPYYYRCPYSMSPEEFALDCVREMEETIVTATSGRIAAVIAEPIQGVGGFITPPANYFQEVARVVRKYGGLFIADEVQTGFGRTGKWFGIEHYGVVPDLMTFAKGMANGFPIGATIATSGVGQKYTGPTIATFGGNPVTMAAAKATLGVIREEGLVDNSRVQGGRLRKGLEQLKTEYPIIGDVRGMGLMQALEFVRDDKEPAPELVREFFEYTRDAGLLIGKGGLYGNAVRIAPPMTVASEQVDEALEVMSGALRKIYEQHKEL